MSENAPANPFWDFTLAIYRREGVSAACIALQDSCGLDVNFLLISLYGGTRGQALTAADFARLEERAGPWRQNVNHPLRAVRRWLKEQSLLAPAISDPLRRGVLGQEIESERLQQQLMSETVTLGAGAPDAAVAAGNLARYLGFAKVRAGEAERASLATLLSQAFEGCGPDQAQTLLRAF